MSPKTKISKQEIIDAAFSIADTEGLTELSVRKIALRLGCSVAPIYVNFKNADDLMDAIKNQAHQMHLAMCEASYTDEPFLNIGIGTVMFAYQHKRLYKDIIEAKQGFDLSCHAAHPAMIEKMRTDKKLKSFDDQALCRILFKMSTFTNGLCVYAAADPMPKGITIDSLLDALEQTGNDVISGEIQRQRGTDL